jgi:hypothetical protein
LVIGLTASTATGQLLFLPLLAHFVEQGGWRIAAGRVVGALLLALAYCKRRKTPLSAEMTTKRAKTSTLVVLIERNRIGGGKIVETFVTDSSAFGIGLLICGPVLQTRFERELSALDSPRLVEREIGNHTNFLSSRPAFVWIESVRRRARIVLR